MSSVEAGSPLRPATEGRARRAFAYLRAFWDRAYRENITGMAAMVAFNLLLALFPFALLVLFIFGQIIESPSVEASVLRDLQELFPDAEQDSLVRVLDRVRENSTTIGIVAAVGGIWIGASFWGAMDTAFCRIYHVECRGWLAQKRFALVMLLVVVLFLAASVVLPALEGILISRADDLPFGIGQIADPRQPAAAGRDPDHRISARLPRLLGGAQGPPAVARGLARRPLPHRGDRNRQLGVSRSTS